MIVGLLISLLSGVMIMSFIRGDVTGGLVCIVIMAVLLIGGAIIKATRG